MVGLNGTSTANRPSREDTSRPSSSDPTSTVYSSDRDQLPPSNEDEQNEGLATVQSARSLEITPFPINDNEIEKGPALSQALPSEKDPNLMDWDGPDDPGNPMNWTKFKKWYLTMLLASLTFCITFSSSIFSQATAVSAEEFGVSEIVTTLATSFVLLGFAFGPMIWGPLSELYGRSRPLLVGFIISTIFQVPVAVAQNLHTVLICRFIIGLCGCSPIAIVGGALADIWDPVNRGIAGASFAGATFIGPIAGPIVGGFIVHSDLGWRWTAWVTLFIQATLAITALVTLTETYAPVLLQRRAARLRLETRNWALHATLDEQRPTLGGIVTKYLFRPMQMLFQEPILLLVTAYSALTYGILYLFFFAYPISFQKVRGWRNPGIASLPFLGLLVGILSGCIATGYWTQTVYNRRWKQRGRVPELRLPPMKFAAISLPIGLFWFGWTSSPSISWVPQTIAGIPIGMGIIMIFLQGINYIVDVYEMYANSALAANTFVRGLSAAAFPLFASQMYSRLGVDWATSLLGFCTVAMMPIPFLFEKYGARIRQKSRFVPKL